MSPLGIATATLSTGLVFGWWVTWRVGKEARLFLEHADRESEQAQRAQHRLIAVSFVFPAVGVGSAIGLLRVLAPVAYAAARDAVNHPAVSNNPAWLAGGLLGLTVLASLDRLFEREEEEHLGE